MRPILTPNLMVEDVAATVRFYQEVLGYELVVGVVTMAKGEEEHNFVMELSDEISLDWANIKGDDTEFMFQSRESLGGEIPVLKEVAIGASQTLYLRIDDVDAHYAKCCDKVEVVAEPTNKFYGMREWYLKDNNGYILCFGQEISQ